MECVGLFYNARAGRNVNVILLLVWISSSRHHKTLNVSMKCSSLVIWNRAYVVMYECMCVYINIRWLFSLDFPWPLAVIRSFVAFLYLVVAESFSSDIFKYLWSALNLNFWLMYHCFLIFIKETLLSFATPFSVLKYFWIDKWEVVGFETK